MRLPIFSRRLASSPGQLDDPEKDPFLKSPRFPGCLHLLLTNGLYQIAALCSIALFLAAFTLRFQGTYDVETLEPKRNASISSGTFKDPSANVRPRFRYWLPDASVNSSQVADDIRAAGKVGAGGVELLGYYLYGNVQIFPGNYDLLQSDWTVYYFGSPAWSEIVLPFTVRCLADTKGKRTFRPLCWRPRKKKGFWWTLLSAQIKEQVFRPPPNQMASCGIYSSSRFPSP